MPKSSSSKTRARYYPVGGRVGKKESGTSGAERARRAKAKILVEKAAAILLSDQALVQHVALARGRLAGSLRAVASSRATSVVVPVC